MERKRWKPYLGKRLVCTVRAGSQTVSFTDTLRSVVREWIFDDEFDPTDPERMMLLVFDDHTLSVPIEGWANDGAALVFAAGDAMVRLEQEGEAYVATTLW